MEAIDDALDEVKDVVLGDLTEHRAQARHAHQEGPLEGVDVVLVATHAARRVERVDHGDARDAAVDGFDTVSNVCGEGEGEGKRISPSTKTGEGVNAEQEVEEKKTK